MNINFFGHCRANPLSIMGLKVLKIFSFLRLFRFVDVRCTLFINVRISNKLIGKCKPYNSLKFFIFIALHPNNYLILNLCSDFDFVGKTFQ